MVQRVRLTHAQNAAACIPPIPVTRNAPVHVDVIVHAWARMSWSLDLHSIETKVFSVLTRHFHIGFHSLARHCNNKRLRSSGHDATQPQRAVVRGSLLIIIFASCTPRARTLQMMQPPSNFFGASGDPTDPVALARDFRYMRLVTAVSMRAPDALPEVVARVFAMIYTDPRGECRSD